LKKMNYKKFKPSKKLEKLIDSYWLFSNLNRNENQRILPDGCADIIFNLGKSNNAIPKETIAISGMMTKFFDVSLLAGSELLGIRFKSGQLSNLTDYPLFEIKNKTVDASEIIPELNLEKLEQLKKQKNIENKLKLIESIIYKILNTKKLPVDSLVSSVTDFILNSSEPINISKLANNHYISLRQLERRFKNKIGVSVKEFTGIFRFKQTIKSIANNPDKSLLHIAFDNGYYDHSHLTNEIKRFSGQIPSDFR
ncbi:MAG: helix-turn-helix domain-containing protein, partial [Bacteroidales bacterium]|nr:helix-turn-helix domain-containing protein [Bacteroidales bacterium]